MPDKDHPSIIAEQRRRNETTQWHWEQYATHRQHVMQLLGEAAPGCAATLCLLGAGNGNDVEISRLTQSFRQICLVDLDARALDHAVSPLTPPECAHVRLVGNADVTGILPQLEAWWSTGAPSDTELERAKQQAATASVHAISERFDVVASTCLLSQLVESVGQALGETHPRCLELLFAVRDRHLEYIIDLTAPGGCGLLITDFVSSTTCPQLASILPDELPRVCLELLKQRNFFTGVNPLAIFKRLQEDPVLSVRVEQVELIKPWIWNLGARQYAVCAVRFRTPVK